MVIEAIWPILNSLICSSYHQADGVVSGITSKLKSGIQILATEASNRFSVIFARLKLTCQTLKCKGILTSNQTQGYLSNLTNRTQGNISYPTNQLFYTFRCATLDGKQAFAMRPIIQ